MKKFLYLLLLLFAVQPLWAEMDADIPANHLAQVRMAAEAGLYGQDAWGNNLWEDGIAGIPTDPTGLQNPIPNPYEWAETSENIYGDQCRLLLGDRCNVTIFAWGDDDYRNCLVEVAADPGAILPACDPGTRIWEDRLRRDQPDNLWEKDHWARKELTRQKLLKTRSRPAGIDKPIWDAFIEALPAGNPYKAFFWVGTQFYILDTGGSDSGSCTIGSPCSTLDYIGDNGLWSDASDDRIWLGCTDFDGADSCSDSQDWADSGIGGSGNSWSWPNGNSFTDSLEVAAYPGEDWTLSAPTIGLWTATDHVEFSDFSINGSGFTGNQITILGVAVEYVRFTSVEWYNCYKHCLLTSDATADTQGHHEFLSISMHDGDVHQGTAEGESWHLIYLAVGNSLIDGGVFHDAVTPMAKADHNLYCIHAYSDNGFNDNNIIRNATVWNCDFDITNRSGTDTLTYNNIAYDSAYNACIHTAGGASSSGNYFVFNTVVGCASYGMFLESGPNGVWVAGILCYSVPSNCVEDQATNTHTGTSLDSDSVTFVDEMNDDYHVDEADTSGAIGGCDGSEGSPTIDSFFDTDIDGETRPTNNVWTCGADEPGAAPPTADENVCSDQTTSAATGMSLTCNVTLSSNTVLIAFAFCDNYAPTTAPAISTFTWNSNGLTDSSITQESDDGVGKVGMEAWTQKAPDTGEHTLSVTWDTTCTYGQGLAMIVLADKDQTTSFRTAATDADTSDTPSVTPTTVSGDVVVAVILKWSTTTLAPGTGETEQWEEYLSSPNEDFAGYTETATGASTTIAPTGGGSTPWGMIAIPVIDAGGSPPFSFTSFPGIGF